MGPEEYLVVHIQQQIPIDGAGLVHQVGVAGFIPGAVALLQHPQAHDVFIEAHAAIPVAFVGKAAGKTLFADHGFIHHLTNQRPGPAGAINLVAAADAGHRRRGVVPGGGDDGDLLLAVVPDDRAGFRWGFLGRGPGDAGGLQ